MYCLRTTVLSRESGLSAQVCTRNMLLASKCQVQV